MLVGPTQIRRVSPVPRSKATGLTAAVYDQMERDFGLVAPPVALHAASPGVLAATWTLLRETLVAGRAGRLAKESVATGVSQGNACGYCTEIHGAAVGLLSDGPTGSPLTRWARSTAGPGRPGPPPCEDADLPEILGTAVAFHYLNRMVEIFLSPTAVPRAAPAAGRRAVLRVLTGAMVRDTPAAVRGDSAELLPGAALPREFGWADAEPTVAAGLARAAAAIDDAAAWLPAPVRAAVVAEVTRRAGAPPPLGRSWLADATSGLPGADGPAARLILLTALAAPQVGTDDLTAFRARYPSDARLVEATAWGALTAARDVAARFSGPTTAGPAAAAPDSTPSF
ncbi:MULTISPECIES: hypothetical protein [unclassified Streptomyces]|uniref:hypothetical protein n=1 Tax=unclassified Streptomyces TaxID=2593676 RepID=UPI0015E16A6D|nr:MULTISPECIES: hypothetical protein [unclassified Streptomyces]